MPFFVLSLLTSLSICATPASMSSTNLSAGPVPVGSEVEIKAMSYSASFFLIAK
ncbi:MAG TPA: hypothetical protein VNW29_06265 [Candidatus Sulfotelmatobacter sp.]|nr:hypothetical protein [Candidatus Sulfotelmatobacter sp.]